MFKNFIVNLWHCQMTNHSQLHQYNRPRYNCPHKDLHLWWLDHAGSRFLLYIIVKWIIICQCFVVINILCKGKSSSSSLLSSPLLLLYTGGAISSIISCSWQISSFLAASYRAAVINQDQITVDLRPNIGFSSVITPYATSSFLLSRPLHSTKSLA